MQNEMMSELAVPEYSLYSGDYDGDTQPIRIDSDGKYKGTIFVYDKISVDDEKETLTYSVTVLLFLVDGEEAVTFDADAEKYLHTNFFNPILVDILTNTSAAKEIENEA